MSVIAVAAPIDPIKLAVAFPEKLEAIADALSLIVVGQR
jgi:hypothetical protein